MSEEDQPSRIITLQEIISQYPPQPETFRHVINEGRKDEVVDIIAAEVSRNTDGKIVYVVPGTAKYVQRASKPAENPS